jgi:hypothetical protein
MMTVTVPPLVDTVLRMKVEIIHDIAEGRVPETIACWSDLDDHVDANEYGGFCEDELSDAMIEHFGGRDENYGMPQDMLDYIALAHEAVNAWMIKGGHRVGHS